MRDFLRVISDGSLVDSSRNIVFLLVAIRLVFIDIVVVNIAVDNVAILGGVWLDVALALATGHTAFACA
jgi:hypothetical protein